MVMTAFFRAGSASARGQCRLGLEWWRKAIELCEAITDRSAFQGFIVDPETGIRANSVRTFFERGLFDQARAQSARAVAMSEKSGQPLERSLARWRAAMLEVRLGNPDKVLEHVKVVEDIVLKTSVVQGDGPSRYLRGWAMAQQGDPRGGLALIRDGLERHLRIGMISSSTEVMGYAAEALLLAGEWAAADAELTLAFARVEEIDEHCHVPMLLLLRARVASGQGDEAAAVRWLREALRVARELEAPGFELKAALALVQHPHGTPGDRDALAALLATFDEGHDTPNFRSAVGLLKQ
jgi:tetratricopeptide (TPR) repeat protein